MVRPQNHRRAAEDHSLAAAMAALSSDVFFRSGQTREWRPRMEKPHRAAVSLRDPAATDACGMVFSSIARNFSGSLRCGDGWDRAGSAVVKIWLQTAAVDFGG